MKADACLAAFRRHFVKVRDTYFKDLAAAKEWRVALERSAGMWPARCNPETKTVIVYVPFAGHSVEALLAHELTHAVTGGQHDAAFTSRLAMVAEDARRIGNVLFADAIEKDLHALNEADEIPAPNEHQARLAFDDALQDMPSATFEEAVGIASQVVGLSMADFLRQFPAAQDMYEEAREITGQP